MRLSPPHLPMPYSMLAPPMDPSVAAATIRKTLNFPAALRLPERGRITSEGMGGKTASRAINRATPAYPTEAMTFVAQVTSCATSSAMQGYYTTGKVLCRYDRERDVSPTFRRPRPALAPIRDQVMWILEVTPL